MGGSLALALRLAQRMSAPRFALHLTLVDRNPETRAAVQHLGDLVTDSFAEGVAHADWIILAVPVRAVIGALVQLPDLRPDGCMVMDVGSSKVEIGTAMDSLPDYFHAIGGHPMCGKETSGFGSATPDLYREQTFVLCHNSRTTDEVAEQAAILLELIGAKALYLSPVLHDNIVAAISHLPYVVSAALMQTAVKVQSEHTWQVSASGFRDTSRVSGTNSTMMLDILLTNKTAILAQLENYKQQLTAVAQLIESEDEDALKQWLMKTEAHYWAYRKIKE